MAPACWRIPRPSIRRARAWCDWPTSTPSSLAQVPVHLVVGVRLADLAVTDEGLPRTSIVGGASVYPFVQNLLLALRGEGLGAALDDAAGAGRGGGQQACWRCPRRSRWPRTSASAIAPIRGPGRLARRPVSEFAFAERFGEPLS